VHRDPGGGEQLQAVCELQEQSLSCADELKTKYVPSCCADRVCLSDDSWTRISR
jgi:hypothetical protein